MKVKIDKDCVRYLQSDEVIKIIKADNNLLHSKVFNCLRKLKSFFYTMIPLKHYSIPDDILLMCAEDAFSETEAEFFKKVRNNDFKPKKEYCAGYVKRVFKRTYLKSYFKEVRKKIIPDDYIHNKELYESENEGQKKLLIKDYISLKIDAVMKGLSEEDNKVYKMKFLEQLNRHEIAETSGISPAAANNKINRFLTRFLKAWSNHNKN